VADSKVASDVLDAAPGRDEIQHTLAKLRGLTAPSHTVLLSLMGHQHGSFQKSDSAKSRAHYAHDLDPRDPRIDDLACRIVDATRERYGTDDLPGHDTNSEIPALIQGAVNASSPAWQRLDTLIRKRLGA